MLRMHFSSADIAHTRIATRVDPLWELVLAIHMLRRQPGDLLFTPWRGQARRALRASDLGDKLSLVLALAPHRGYFPDFLNPAAALHGLTEGLDAIRRTPRATLHRDLRRLARSRRVPATAERIAAGDPTALAVLTDSLRTCYELTIRPYHRTMHTALDRDRRLRTTALATDGVRGLFRSLHPLVEWSADELRIPAHADQDLELDGRGLLLIPAYFCIVSPITLFDPDLPPVLVYPVQHEPDALLAPRPTQHATLAALIGATRAAILDTIGTHPIPTTGELARHLTISAASASEHTTILRNAGLITSHRDRNRIHHQLTPLGHNFLTHNRSAP